jgi:hypothetical protein
LDGVLSKLYFSQDSDDRRLAYEFLGEIAVVKPRFALSIMKLLMNALVDKDITNRVQGLHFLGEIGAISPVFSRDLIYPFILILLKADIEPVIEFYTLKALEKIRKDSPTVRDFLHRGIADVAYLQAAKLSLQNPSERQAAAWRISKLGKIYFPAILDLIPALLNRLVDDDDTVKAVTYNALLDLLLLVKAPMVQVIRENLDTIENPFLRLQALSLLVDLARKEPGFVVELVPLVVKELENPNRAIHLKIQKLLKSLERLSPNIFAHEFKPLLVHMMKSPSRYAYHWAIKTFTASMLSELHVKSGKFIDGFIDDNVALIDLLLTANRGNIMQTRVVLMMLVHECKEAFMRSNQTESPLILGLVESLTQIQKSGLTSETEVVAAYEKFKTILGNSKMLAIEATNSA